MYDYDIRIRTYGETTNISIERSEDERTTLTAARGCTKSFINRLLKELDKMVDEMEETAAEHRVESKEKEKPTASEIKCEVCGRPRVEVANLDIQWVPEYGVFLCKNCHKEVIGVNERLFGKYMSIVHSKVTAKQAKEKEESADNYVYVVVDDDRCTPNSTVQVYVYQEREDAKHMFYGLFDALVRDTKGRKDVSFWVHELDDETLVCDIKCYGEDAGCIQVLKLKVIK